MATNTNALNDAHYKEDHLNGNNYGSDLAPQRTLPTHAAYGGAFAPGPYSEQKFRKFANVAPIGLCGFALTTFVLSLVNIHAGHVTIPTIVIGLALAYGGLVQLLAGMWEVAIGNTFGAVAFSSYGAFWLSFAVIIIPSTGQGFGIVASYGDDVEMFTHALGYYLFGWFIFTTMLLLATLKSTLAFFSLFFFLDITFLLLGVAHFYTTPAGGASVTITKAAGWFGLITAFVAWYNALAGILEKENSFFTIPAVHFPWSEKVRQERAASSNV